MNCRKCQQPMTILEGTGQGNRCAVWFCEACDMSSAKAEPSTTAPLAKTTPARLDADRTAKPKTRIITHPRVGDCVGPGTALVNPELEDENGKRTPLTPRTATADYHPLLPNGDFAWQPGDEIQVRFEENKAWLPLTVIESNPTDEAIALVSKMLDKDADALKQFGWPKTPRIRIRRPLVNDRLPAVYFYSTRPDIAKPAPFTVDNLTTDQLRELAWTLYNLLAVEECNGGDLVEIMARRMHEAGLDMSPQDGAPDDSG